MRLLFNYINRNTDRNTDRSSQLVNINFEVINKTAWKTVKLILC